MPELSTQPEPLVYVSISEDPDGFIPYADMIREPRPFEYQKKYLAQVPEFLMSAHEEAADKLLKAQADINKYDEGRRAMEKLEKERTRKLKREERRAK